MFAERVARSPDSLAYIQFDPSVGSWRNYTWSDMASSVATLQQALNRTSLQPGDRVCQLLPNSVAWVAFDIAAQSLGLVTVPIYAHDSPENAAFIMAESGARLLVTDTLNRWQTLAPLVAQSGQIEEVWLRDSGQNLRSDGIDVRALPKLDGSPQEAFQRPAIESDDLATLVYTSGTTGRPKGVMLSHAAILWNAEAASRFVPPLPSDVFLSILPLAHAFERTLGHYYAMMGGSTTAYARSIDLLREDLATIRPTVFIGVPRLYERIHAAAMEKVEKSHLQRTLLVAASKIGWDIREAMQGRGPSPGLGRTLLWLILKPLVARRAMRAFGGRLRVAVSGGAPLPPEVARFLVGLGLPLVEGYGLTEAGPIVTACTIEDSIPGSVGYPLHGLRMRIANSGELEVRSPAIMKGYWQNEVATRRALDSEGWLRTGDAAHLTDGRVYIEGRLTDTIVLSTGKKIDLVEIETAIARDPLVDQVSVAGTGRPCPIALLVLDRKQWEIFADQHGLDPARPDTTEAESAILKRIEAQQAGFARHALIRAVHPTLEAWTIADGLLTPTLKVKRRAIEKKYEEDIERLYNEIDRDRAKL